MALQGPRSCTGYLHGRVMEGSRRFKIRICAIPKAFYQETSPYNQTNSLVDCAILLLSFDSRAMPEDVLKSLEKIEFDITEPRFLKCK